MSIRFTFSVLAGEQADAVGPFFKALGFELDDNIVADQFSRNGGTVNVSDNGKVSWYTSVPREENTKGVPHFDFRKALLALEETVVSTEEDFRIKLYPDGSASFGCQDFPKSEVDKLRRLLDRIK